MAEPDIRVRLSPEGVKEVLDAMRKVQRESRGATTNAAKGVGLMNAALGELKSLIPHIGFAAAATGIFLIGKNALQSAEHLHKMQQALGGTVEDLSALRFGALLADVEQGKLEKGLQRMGNTLNNLRKGGGDQVEIFAELGLTAADFIGKDAVQAFELLASRIAVVPDEYRKLQITNQIFGKDMAQLVPLLNAVGTQGFGALRQEAERLGLVFSTDLAKAAEEASDRLKVLGKRGEAIAIQFLSGFAEPFAEAMRIFEEETTNRGTNAIKAMGEAVGVFAESAIKLYLIVGRVIGAVLANLEQKANNLGRTVLQIAERVGVRGTQGALIGAGVGAVTGPGVAATTGAGAAIGAGVGLVEALLTPTPGSKQQHEIMQQLEQDIERIVLAAGKTGPASEALKKLLKGGRSDGEGTEATFNTSQRLAALEKQLNLDRIKDLEDVVKNREKIDAGIILSERKVADAKAAANVEAIAGMKAVESAERELLARRAALLQTSAAQELQIAKGKEQLLLAAIKRQSGNSIEGQKLAEAAVRQSSREQLNIQTQLYQSLVALQDSYLQKYRASQQQVIAIDKEVVEARKQLTEFSNQITLDGLDEEGKKNFQFRLAQDKLDQLRTASITGDLEKMREFRREAFSMANDLKSLGDAGAAEKIAQEATRLFELGADARKLASRESGDAAKKAADDIGKQLDQIKQQIDQFKANLVFEVVPTASKSSLSDLVRQIQDELKREPFQITVRAKILAEQLKEGTIVPPGLAGGGRVPGFSPTPHSDNILIRATADEFMQPVRAVRHYGLGFMESIRTLEFPRFAEGGSIGGETESAGPGLHPFIFDLGGRKVTLLGRREQAHVLADMLEQFR